ncbi:unnamed protein product [marine sediment metagenome]|uniref:Spore protein YkvP/CgeB glycosyl transferase-like domain-containing protein n=1 Tax=marine sediment metagenome TaxID=412755 RepID=X0WIW4_9ZZZZ
MPAGVLESECYLGTPQERFKKDIIFVGSYGYHPEWNYRPQLIDWLKNTYGDRFQRFAGDCKYGTIRGGALNDLYASAKVVIGDSLCIGFNYPHYISDRLFETTGRGGFIIFPYIVGIGNYFKLGSELITYDYGDFDSLKKLIDFYVNNNEEREKIQIAGHRRTKKDHTYRNRIEKIFSILKEEGAIE